MPLILVKEHGPDILIVLGPDNIERMQDKDPVEVEWHKLPFAKVAPRVIGIVCATQAEMTQMEQLARQGKTDEAVKMAISGWKYRPDKGDHDLGYQKL
jgi:hypothetical protein